MAGTATQTRPEPMNASPYHSKVKVTLKFADTEFAAGGMVTGKIELECKAEKGLGINVIMVELYAIEELTSRDHSATSTFLHSRRLFQGPGLPPSNSVHPYPAPGDPPLPSHYYHARRGITTFLFQFPLPDNSPSSIEFGSGLARLRYEVRASVGVFWKGEKKLVTDKKQVDVIERFDDYNRGEPEGIIVSENGKIWMQGKVLGGFMVAGEPACIELQVKNHSSKKNSGLSVTLTRELYLPNVPATQKQPLQISDSVLSVSFRGPEYIIQPGVEGVANLVVDIPKHARGVRGGRRLGDGNKSTECLFEVRCTVSVKLAMGIGSKDIRLDLPVTILHPSVVPDFPPPELYAPSPGPLGVPLYDPMSGMLYQPPMSPVPFLDRPTSPYAYPLPPMSPPIGPYIDHGQVWLPPPMTPVPQSLYAPPSYYGHQPEYASMAAYAPPPRPSSTEPAPSQPLHTMPSGAAPAPLIPMPTGTNNDGDREEGKGERASRIAHHLRMSSRARSASPPAHRYHLPEALPAHATISPTALHSVVGLGLPTAQDALSNPASSPELHTRPNLTLSPLPTGGDVVSPRPMLSPKASFSKDPFEQVNAVENLERLAATDAPALAPASLPSPALSRRSLGADPQNKTLPKPPVPSTKDLSSTPRANIDALFPADLLLAGADETPPTPTLAAAVTSLRPPRAVIGGLSSGLDALEARLLAEVGTRKPEKPRAPDVRNVLLQEPEEPPQHSRMPAPITIPRPAADVDPPVDSAISSLTLPGLDDERTLKRAGLSRGASDRGAERDEEREREQERERDREMELVATSTERARGSKETMRARESRETMRGRERESRETKAAKGSGGARKKAAAEGEGKDKELQKLRKAAQGRITAWLGSIDPEEPPQSATPPPDTPPATLTPEPEAKEARGRSRSKSRLHSDVPGGNSSARSPAVSPARSAKEAPVPPKSPVKEPQASPNPRSSGFLPMGTIRAMPTGSKPGTKPTALDAFLMSKASSRLAVYPPRSADPEAKYDVRSARGGKGGIVTSVAAIWAQGGQPASPFKPSSSKPAPSKAQANAARLAEQWQARTRADASKPTPKPKLDLTDGRPKAMRPVPKAARASPAVTSPSSDPMVTSLGDLTARRARMVKATPATASVSSSTAVPTLSSTASLARPAPARADRTKLNMRLPPTVSEAVESRADMKSPASSSKTDTPRVPGSPPPKTEYGFGQAKLRELIKRYQGQVNPSS